jgi:hypothetical protein
MSAGTNTVYKYCTHQRTEDYFKGNTESAELEEKPLVHPFQHTTSLDYIYTSQSRVGRLWIII